MKLHARVLGEGRPLLILHGLFGMSDNWQSLAKRWAEEFAVHLIDLRNHGRSPHHPDISYQAMADDLQAYCGDNNLEKILLLGHSMGGKAAMLLAALQPELIEKMIVVDIGPKEYPLHHQMVIEALEALPLSELQSRSEAEQKFASELEPGVRLFLLKNLYWKEKDQLAWRFNLRNLVNQIEEVGAALPAQAYVEVPTLFVRGGASDYITDADWAQIQNQFPNARLETLAGAGHWLHAEKPTQFYPLVREFLAP